LSSKLISTLPGTESLLEEGTDRYIAYSILERLFLRSVASSLDTPNSGDLLQPVARIIAHEMEIRTLNLAIAIL
jgi:hypothetical protein